MTSTANPIEEAVRPLKADAMDRAEKYARAVIADVAAQLKAADNDLEKCAPYPSSIGCGSRAEYMSKLAKYTLFRNLTTSRVSCRNMHDPNFADMNSNYKAKFIKEAREDAALQYEAYVIKLIKKIGQTTSATLEGNHVWAHSILRVVNVTGETQNWKTKMIINQSKLGKVFNQFPTRKVKQ